MNQDAPDAQELSRLFTLGNAQRKVGGTKMNAESSRSHSIFSVLLEVREVVSVWPIPENRRLEIRPFIALRHPAPRYLECT